MKQLLIASFLSALLPGCRNTDFEAAVRTAVERQMNAYPASTLADLYKNFFQDSFGPGHLVGDTAAAGRYLRKELDSYTQIEGETAEPTGYAGRFYRVNLSVIKTGQAPYPIFFDAFVRSVNSIRPPSVAEWKRQWQAIEAIIRTMPLDLPDYETDRREIEERLDRGETAGHHSPSFEAHYAPHYRIISKEIYEKEIAPLIKQSSNQL
ncbi:MAG: hypothetical protein LBP25_05200 [Tannerellaceae bacterium]|jgi:hypothetical protein|nr:hypothetical protein [Tannerellaceae bacterium]